MQHRKLTMITLIPVLSLFLATPWTSKAFASSCQELLQGEHPVDWTLRDLNRPSQVLANWDLNPTTLTDPRYKNYLYKVHQIRIPEIQRASELTVGLVHPSGLGTGFIVSAEGHILTAAHVLEAGWATWKKRGSVRIGAEYVDLSKASVLYNNSIDDVAVLKIPQLAGRDYLTLADKSFGPEPILAIGFPSIVRDARGQRTKAISVGHWTEYQKAIQEQKKQVIMVEAVRASGMSGGPFLNQRGEVIGLIGMGGYEPRKNDIHAGP